MPVGPTTTGTGFSSVISAEVPCQLLPLDQEPSRTAVRAGDRFLRRLEICQQPALLGDIKRVAESHRGMARERRGRLLDCTIAPVLGERRQGFRWAPGYPGPACPIGRRTALVACPLVSTAATTAGTSCSVS